MVRIPLRRSELAQIRVAARKCDLTVAVWARSILILASTAVAADVKPKAKRKP